MQDEHMNVMGYGQLRCRAGMSRSVSKPRQGCQQQPDRWRIVLVSAISHSSRIDNLDLRKNYGPVAYIDRVRRRNRLYVYL